MTEDQAAELRADERRGAVAQCAIEVFARYGFRRSSMEDIAAAAGMSRPALYQHFSNKAEIFRASSELAQATAFEAAKGAAEGDDLAARLAAMLIAYKKPTWRIFATTPHGEELLGLNAALAGDVTEAAEIRARALFARVLGAAAAPGWDAEEAARLLLAAAWSVATQTVDEESFDRDVSAVARIWAAAVTGTVTAPPPG